VEYLHESTRFTDGSLESDIPMRELAESFNVSNIVVS
jgi:predicted acylesterase/phospholipase RssA